MQADQAERRRGLASAIGAFLLWGLVFPLYLKLLDEVSPLEIVAHRIVWALPFAALMLAWFGRLRGVGAFFTPRMLGVSAVTASLISVNWSLYVYALVYDHALEAALGYYINPLLNVVLAAVFLGERPNRPQGFAIALAAIGVLVLTVKAGGLPWISLVLALSFGVYGLLRKTQPIEATEGFFLEVSILFVPAAVLVAWTMASGDSRFLADGAEAALLVGIGPLTAIPLILFAAGARLLPYSTVGILQYLVPTLLFLTAVFVFGEPFGAWQLVAFAFIWAGLALYSWSLFDKRREGRSVAAPVVEST